jgi:hypothetical protein
MLRSSHTPYIALNAVRPSPPTEGKRTAFLFVSVLQMSFTYSPDTGYLIFYMRNR